MAIEAAVAPVKQAAAEPMPAPALAGPPPHTAIGVLGGTFDPIHFGHLRFAEEIIERCGLSQVRLIACGIPPHRRPPRASPAHRFAMVCLAAERNAALAADQSEIFRDRPCYTVDTLMALRAEFGPQTPICLLLGADAFLQLPSWHRWQALFELAHLIVAQRPGHALDPAALPAALAAEFAARFDPDPRAVHGSRHGLIVTASITALDISATSVRANLAAQRSARYLLPDVVLDYIQTNHLYQETDEAG